jgi:hypothetical protein
MKGFMYGVCISWALILSLHTVIKAFAQSRVRPRPTTCSGVSEFSLAGNRPRLDPPDVVTIAACINAWAGHIVDTEVAWIAL